jgi:thymidylate kinase
MAEPHEPLLVAVTGIDGSGKSTLVQNLVAALTAQGLTATAFRALEADKKFIDGVRAHREHDRGQVEGFLAQYTGWSLVTNTRRQLVAGERVDVVVADRYVADYWANQLTFGMELDALRWVSELIPAADLTVVLDVDPATAWARVLRRDRESGWQSEEFLEKAAQCFAAAVKLVSHRPVASLAADLSADTVAKAAETIVLARLRGDRG